MRVGPRRSLLVTLAAGVAFAPPSAASQSPPGYIGKTLAESRERPIERPEARAGAPNVLVWMIDDTGFGQLSCYGGLVDTPNIDRVAARGLRYSNYHTTPICSASRASLLTGRNSHRVHIGGHSAMAIGFPGQDALVPPDAGTIADNLREAGYLTYALGKWDHLPPEDASAAGPFTYWPSGQGFDRFYGFLSYDANNFAPSLWSDHQPVELPADPAYHLSADMAERAVEWIGSRDTGAAVRRPFLMYWATGAAHSPHHAPETSLNSYQGRFDTGWDVARERILASQKRLGLVPADTQLPPRPDGMPAWDSLAPDQQRSYARQMEAFAAQLSHADAQFGRILDALERRGELDNTIVVIVSDNGASGEGAIHGTFNEFYMANGRHAEVAQNLAHQAQWGGPETYPLYPVGWAVAGDTPFRYYKQTAFEGGTRVPLVIAWPKGIAARGEVRDQYHHVSDVLPTLLEAAGVAPAPRVRGQPQMPFDGVSLAYSFDRPDAPTARRVQYYEMYGNRALWADGWKAVMPHRLRTWDFSTQPPITDDGWQLYDMKRDINERHDVAAQHPERLAKLVELFDREARRNNVYPLTNTGGAQQLRRARQDAALDARGRAFTFAGPVSRIPEALAPPIQTHSFTMSGVVQSAPGANGTIMAMGGRFGGVGLYLQGGVPVMAYRGMDGRLSVVKARRGITGTTRLGLRFTRKGPDAAEAVLLADGAPIANGRVDAMLSTFSFSSNETFDLGSDTGTTVLPGATAPFRLQGTVRDVRFDIDRK